MYYYYIYYKQTPKTNQPSTTVLFSEQIIASRITGEALIEILAFAVHMDIQAFRSTLRTPYEAVRAFLRRFAVSVGVFYTHE